MKGPQEHSISSRSSQPTRDLPVLGGTQLRESYPIIAQDDQNEQVRRPARRKSTSRQGDAENEVPITESTERLDNARALQPSRTASSFATAGLDNTDSATSKQISLSSSKGTMTRTQPVTTGSGRNPNSSIVPARFCRRIAVDPSERSSYEQAPRVTCCCETASAETTQEQQSVHDSGQVLDLDGPSAAPTSREASVLYPFNQPLDLSHGLEDVDFEDDIQLFCDCGPGCTCVGCMIHQFNAVVDSSA